jgi:hypothetical protein
LSLSKIIKGKTPMPRRVMLYGVEGVGKSTFGAMAPKPIFIQTEDGANDLGPDRFPLAQNMADVINNLGELYTADHDYETVAIDSVDWLERMIFEVVCRENNVRSIEKIDFGKGYKFALQHWSKILEGLTALRNHRGMGIVLIAHATTLQHQDPTQESYDRYAPAIHKTASAIIREWCDEVLFANWQTARRSEDLGFNSQRGIGIGTGNRVLYTQERPAWYAKNRLNMPPEIPLDYREFAKYAAGSVPVETSPDAADAAEMES